MKLESNLIYCGDNLEILAEIPEKSVDLIYADPPFFSGKHYEIIWGNGAEQKVYEDRWKGGINVYIEWMKERLWQCYRVLKDTGSIYLHCDWHASHRLRVTLDNIFGEKNFRNEIIWCYTGGGISKRQFRRKHDIILFYSKSNSHIFNPPIIKRGKSKFYKKGIEVQSEGRVLEDWWSDIPARGTATHSKEWLGYPTQKPEALLKRIIETSSNKDDIVLDPFCGCGTTLVVAHQLDRRWVGIDISPTACNLMRNRLGKVGATDIRIIGALKTVEELKKLSDWEFQNWVIDRIGGVPSPKKSADMGIDGYTFMERFPVQVKQSESVGRNIVDNFETAVRREHKDKGYIVAFSFSKSAYEEAARCRFQDNLEVILVPVEEIGEYF